MIVLTLSLALLSLSLSVFSWGCLLAYFLMGDE